MKISIAKTLILALSLASIAATTSHAAPSGVATIRVGTGAPLADLQVSRDGTAAFIIADDAKYYDSAQYDKVEIYDLNARQLAHAIGVGERANTLAIAANATEKQGQFAVRSTYYGAVSLQDSVALWAYPSEKRVDNFGNLGVLDNRLVIERDGSKMAINEEGTISLFDAAGQKLAQPQDEIVDLTILSATAHTLSPDGTRLIVGWPKGALAIYDATNFAKPRFAGDVPRLREIARLDGHQADVTRLNWSKAGDSLLSSDKNGRVQMWNWPAQNLKLAWQAATGPISAVEFAPDGNSLAIATATPANGIAVGLWDAATGTPRGNWKHWNAAHQLAWRDGQTLVIGDEKGALLLVPVSEFAPVSAN